MTDREATAHHEAAHCVVAMALGVEVAECSIEGNEEAEGWVKTGECRLGNWVLVALAGACASLRIGQGLEGSEVDLEAVLSLLRERMGMAPTERSLGPLTADCLALVERWWPQIEEVAWMLLAAPTGSLSPEQLADIGEAIDLVKSVDS